MATSPKNFRRDADPSKAPDREPPSEEALPAEELAAQAEAQEGFRKDTELINAFKDGDSLAFHELVLKYEDRVYNHCLRLISDEEESFDLTQEVFLKVFRKIKNYEHTYAFYTWLYRITVNSCIDYMRRKKRMVPSISLSMTSHDNAMESGREHDIPDTTFTPTSHYEKAELNTKLNEALEQLSEKLRIILVLKEMEGFSYEEIAEILGVSRGTVKSRLFRARERLKELLEGSGTA